MKHRFFIFSFKFDIHYFRLWMGQYYLFEINSQLFLSRRTDGFFSIRVFFKLSDKNSACLLALSKIYLSFSDSCVLGTVTTRPRVSFEGEFFLSEFFCLVLFYSFYLEAEANRLFTYLRFFSPLKYLNIRYFYFLFCNHFLWVRICLW